MRLSLLKAKKSVFNLRGVIIAISGENAIEAKREANKSIFSIVRVIRTDLFFYIVYDFSFYVVIQPSFSPFGNFIFGFPSNRNSFFIKTSHFCKFFNSQFTFFKFIFKLLIIHLVTFKKLIYLALYQNIANKVRYIILTYSLIKLYNFGVKANFISFFKKIRKETK